MILMASVVAFAQSRIITGTVISNEDDLGVPGATVLVMGTTIGIATDIDGKYSINVPPGNNVLVFSFLGTKTQKINIGQQSIIDVVVVLNK
jgi:hypothetical protein